jgi:trk system potassium uptake protein TrkA
MVDQRFVLIGLGTFGREIAKTLNERNAEIIVIDKDPVVVNQMKTEGFKYAVNIDNLDFPSLSRFVKPEDIVILSMGDAFEPTILTIEMLKEIGVKSIYARATRDIQQRIFEKLEITEVLFPEKQEGRRFALKLLNWDINFIDEFTKDIYLIEYPVTGKLIGHTVMDLRLRSKYNVNIIGLKRTTREENKPQKTRMEYVGFESTVLDESHSLLVIGKEDDLEEMMKGIS